ncbi:MAG: flippase-like domain-containing protein [Dehalococcoidia bacterium]|nr:flippase-like domain-containing protein [Dehalococcoidia bacterium]
MTSSSLRQKFVISLLLGVLVFGGLAAYGDFPQLIAHFEEFRWELLPLILLVTSGNYILRFFKWQYYLRQIGVVGLSAVDSFLIYFSGLGMTVTPGKAGEWLKVHLLNEMHGTSVTKSTPILIAERLTDALGLLIIAAAGVVVFGRNPLIIGTVVTFAGGGVLVVWVLRRRRLSHWLLGLLARVPVVRRLEPHFEEFYEGTYTVMQPRGILLMTALSVASWFFEVAAFYLTLIGVGTAGSFDTLFKAAFILPIATLVAALLPTPGGLGVAEAGITSLSLRLFKEMTKSTAAVATLIVRLATLWFGVGLGLLMFAVLTRRLARRGIRLDDTPQPAAVVDSGAG